MIEYAASWSGGKDSCFAHWKAISQGLKVGHLLNVVNQDSTVSMSHGIAPDLIALQARAMGMPIFQQKVTPDAYEAGFKDALSQLKLQGVTGLVTGDIYFQPHKDWIDRVCGDVGIRAVLPLWEINTARVLTEFIDAGFKAIVVCAQAKYFGKEWMGREVDNTFTAELHQLAEELNIDLCGEAGEYHTFVYDGPTFNKSVKIGRMTPVARDDHWFLDIREYSID
jgi:uncharacterized protein (TIGR00290 family)